LVLPLEAKKQKPNLDSALRSISFWREEYNLENWRQVENGWQGTAPIPILNRGSGQILALFNGNSSVERQVVGTGPEASDLSDAHCGDHRLVAELFAGMDVRQMDFNRWYAYR
jgi:hypothetical protein